MASQREHFESEIEIKKRDIRRRDDEILENDVRLQKMPNRRCVRNDGNVN